MLRYTFLFCVQPSIFLQSTISIIASIVLTPDEVYQNLSNLDENKATGPDKIPAILLKNCASSISKSLCEFLHKSVASSKLADEWQLSYIIPILKKCLNDEVTNYRPISLLSVVSKVNSRTMHLQSADSACIQSIIPSTVWLT